MTLVPTKQRVTGLYVPGDYFQLNEPMRSCCPSTVSGRWFFFSSVQDIQIPRTGDGDGVGRGREECRG